jgi:hypothetical protein
MAGDFSAFKQLFVRTNICLTSFVQYQFAFKNRKLSLPFLPILFFLPMLL